MQLNSGPSKFSCLGIPSPQTVPDCCVSLEGCSSHMTRVPPAQNLLFVLLVFLLGITSGIAYWAISWIMDPNRATIIKALYRFGDTDYLSLVYAVSRMQFHEFISEGIEPPRIVPFPFGLSLFYALPITLFSDHGLLFGDLIISVIRVAACLAIGRILFKKPGEAAAAAVVIFVMTGPLPIVSRYWDLFYRPLWDMRYLRPYVTGLIALCLVLSTYHFSLALDRKHRSRVIYTIHGALIGLAPQGDLHLGIIAAFVTATLFLFSFLRSPSQWRMLLIVAANIVGVCIIVISPMLIQILSAHPDVSRRLGQIPLRRLAPPFLISIGPWAEICALALFYGIFRWSCVGDETAAPTRRLLTIVLLFAVTSLLALPLSVLVLGRGVQIYHFPFRAFGFVILGFTLIILVFGQKYLDKLGGRGSRWVSTSLATVLILSLSTIHLSFLGLRAVNAARSDIQQRTWESGWSPIPGYHRDLDDLWGELSRPMYHEHRVLATFDQQLAMLWTTRAEHRVWIPDPFLSTVPDEAIERRLISFAQLVGMTPSEFDRHLGEEYFSNHLLNGMKWHASRYYTFSGIEEYSPEQQKLIKQRYWSTTIPYDERRRLNELFTTPLAVDAQLDLIVLDHGPDFGKLPGPTTNFRKIYENPTFTVWTRGRADGVPLD
jgi:hypothetical protein